ncbi:hypothetical protein HPB51_027981 [Rhipicephalus microplus]|uniref:Uncharacterized protein n=1 Tax=Rhipicephalus microplus TaxID=6941 RepID=A0A9J6CYE8_RHIMP|nr:hypothetical protein HPB51_027981 [Rhipicephalus microplus]
MWRIGMTKKSALEIYRTFKQEITKERIYDNTRGSSLLFEARTGVLRTKTYRAKYEGVDHGEGKAIQLPGEILTPCSTPTYLELSRRLIAIRLLRLITRINAAFPDCHSGRPARLSCHSQHQLGAHSLGEDGPVEDGAVAKRLPHLLTRHHCVTSMEIWVWIFWRFDELVYDALCNNLGLRKLKLTVSWSYFTRPPAHGFGAVLLHMNHLRELTCEGKHMDRSFAHGLSEFLASTSSLRTLNLSKFNIKHSKDAVAILEALGRNKSIATLSIKTSPLYPEILHWKWPRYALFATGYLCRNKRLRTLSVTSHVPHFRLVRSMIETLLTNRYLTELSLINIRLEPRDMELINQLIIQNKTLTSLSLIKCRFHKYAGHIDENTEAVTSRAHSFVLAFTNNNMLQQLTLTPSWFSTNEYRSLVEAEASHASLKQVNLDVPKRKDAVEIYRVVRENGAQDHFHRGMQNVLPENADLFSRKEAVAFLVENAVAFTEATGPSGVSVDSQVFFGYAQLLTTLTSQPSCSHVSSFWLLLTRELLNITVTSEIAQYLRGTTTLRDLKLGFDDAEVGDALCEQLTLVNEKEAACLIKARLMKIAELDDFMRLKGVVKHRVTCHSRDDGKKQLVDNGRDCWLYIRQYLKLSDVRNEQ